MSETLKVIVERPMPRWRSSGPTLHQQHGGEEIARQAYAYERRCEHLLLDLEKTKIVNSMHFHPHRNSREAPHQGGARLCG